MARIRFAILTVSDTCANGEKEDKSGSKLQALISNKNSEIAHILRGVISCTAIVPDDRLLIMKYLISWSDQNKADIILTTGGTGFSQRDVTPEATKNIIEKEAPGLSLAMLMSSLKITPMAMLSRSVCGIRNKTLIINLPGSCNAATECLITIAPALSHAIDLIVDNKARVEDTHNIIHTSVLASSDEIKVEKVEDHSRESLFPMISVKDALEIIRKSVQEKKIETVNTTDAYDRILAVNVYSNCNLPPFRASIKDGYAVLANDGTDRRVIVADAKAGNTFTLPKLQSGMCVSVNTGAPVPDGATAVVQIEDTQLILRSVDGTRANMERQIDIMVCPKEGQDIRPIGCDIMKGSLVLNSNTTIGPVAMGLLAACGCKKVKVYKLPSVGILSTGDELQEVGEPLKPGHVYDSNRVTLISLLKENGFHPLDLGIATDDETDMVRKLTEAACNVDVIVTTGSVSMGDRDILKPILLQHFEADIHFGRVNMKPGKPTMFATCHNPTMFNNKKKYFLGLPGNPVSALVTARLFLLPLLNEMSGNYSQPVIVQAKVTTHYNLDPRPEYARAFLKWSDEEALFMADITGNQISSKLLNCKDANALLILPGRTTEKQKLNPGDIVPAMLIGYK